MDLGIQAIALSKSLAPGWIGRGRNRVTTTPPRAKAARVGGPGYRVIGKPKTLNRCVLILNSFGEESQVIGNARGNVAHRRLF